jgi:hypothetical protein
VLDERRIRLLSEDRSFLLTGKLYVAVARYLAGAHTAEDIVAALKPGAPVERIPLALSNMLAKGYAAARGGAAAVPEVVSAAVRA